MLWFIFPIFLFPFFFFHVPNVAFRVLWGIPYAFLTFFVFLEYHQEQKGCKWGQPSVYIHFSKEIQAYFDFYHFLDFDYDLVKGQYVFFLNSVFCYDHYYSEINLNASDFEVYFFAILFHWQDSSVFVELDRVPVVNMKAEPLWVVIGNIQVFLVNV